MAIRIDIQDMYLRDERALTVIRGAVNPETKLCQITCSGLARQLGCHRNTASSIVARLASAGYIRARGRRGRDGGIDIEVLFVLES